YNSVSTLSLHDALPIWNCGWPERRDEGGGDPEGRHSDEAALQSGGEWYSDFQTAAAAFSLSFSTKKPIADVPGCRSSGSPPLWRSEEHTSELQSQSNLV